MPNISNGHRRRGPSFERLKLLVETLLDGSRLKVLLPAREDTRFNHPDRVEEIILVGKRYLSAGLTATAQAQTTVTLVSIVLHIAEPTRSSKSCQVNPETTSWRPTYS